MTERAKLWRWGVVAVVSVAGLGCVGVDTDDAAPKPIYDGRTRQLTRLDWDADHDGYVEQRTYFVGGRAVRSEIDSDKDGRVDRWEYVAADAAVIEVGTSSGADGVEDTWTLSPGADGTTTIVRAQHRDRVMDRRERWRAGVLVEAEEDANRDGLTDKWETWERGVLIAASYDTSFANGRPDRRLVYEHGRFGYLEVDPDGNGQFERLVSNQPGSGEKTSDRH